MTTEINSVVKAQLDRMDFGLFLEYVLEKLADRPFGLQTGRAYQYYHDLIQLTNTRIIRELQITRNAFEKGPGKPLDTSTRLLKQYNPNGSNTQKSRLLLDVIEGYANALTALLSTQKQG
ncbi:MAG: hypothetical protein EOP52_10460 [Sphingobacteriales bacterium]|nr:MAG: hypothetical protein EOP52_10460 [Sphingobacteriales bacterium]